MNTFLVLGSLCRGVRDILPVGRGDFHPPLGWGAIPYQETFTALRSYEGSVITEYRYDLLRPHAARIAHDLRARLQHLSK
jgi:sugar phosphate isomerase/epimerase